ncbi:PREDICTED: uncharacterized protein LOC101309522 [Fragaria vesca subsp. vesca]
MDFVEGLPVSDGYNAIMVVVDRLSKYAHFIAVSHPFTAAQIATIFMRDIFRLHGTSNVQSVDKSLQSRDQLLLNLRSHLQLAQHRMKQFADRKRTEREFLVNDWVFLKIHPYRQKSLANRTVHKLSPRYYGPYQILECIGTVAYRLKLPPNSKIHPVFHVSLLKKRIGEGLPVSTTLPQFDSSGDIIWQPLRVLDMGVRTKKKQRITTWLVQWKSMSEEDATWEDARTMVCKFPDFCVRGRAQSHGGST